MERFEDFLHITVLSNTIQTWLIGIGIIVVFIILRFKLIAFFVRLLKHLASNTKTTIDDKIVAVIEKPLQWIVVIVGFHLGISYFTLGASIAAGMEHFVRSLLMLMTMWIVYNALAIFSDIFRAVAMRLHSDLGESLAGLLLSVIKSLVIIIAVVAVLQEWGFNVSAFLASLGLIGMAFALAAKDTASNLFGSLVIFTDRPFKIGDWIKTPHVEGTIEGIGIRSTKVRTFAQALVSVPNGVLANVAILNWSRMPKRRIKMTIGLTYATTSQQMQNILDQIRTLLQNDSDIHPETIYVHFTDFQESALGIFCYFFTQTTQWGEYMAVRERINLEIMQIVEQNGASFAFPSQSVYVETFPQNDVNV